MPDVRSDPSFLADFAAAWNAPGVDVFTFRYGRIAPKHTCPKTRLARKP